MKKITRRAIIKALKNKDLKIICIGSNGGYSAQWVDYPYTLNEVQRQDLIEWYERDNRTFTILDWEPNKFYHLRNIYN